MDHHRPRSLRHDIHPGAAVECGHEEGSCDHDDSDGRPASGRPWLAPYRSSFVVLDWVSDYHRWSYRQAHRRSTGLFDRDLP